MSAIDPPAQPKPPMKSATSLGRDFGLTASEMNFVLKEEGFLEGSPGLWRVTEKGAPFAIEENHHRGPGGYARFNRDWETRRWDESVLSDVDLSPARTAELRQAIKDAKQAILPTTSDDVAVDASAVESKALVAAVGVVLLAAGTYGVAKCAPYISRWWNDRAIPGVKGARARLLAKFIEDSASDEDDETK